MMSSFPESSESVRFPLAMWPGYQTVRDTYSTIPILFSGQ
jgi:hypothetical protein